MWTETMSCKTRNASWFVPAATLHPFQKLAPLALLSLSFSVTPKKMAPSATGPCLTHGFASRVAFSSPLFGESGRRSLKDGAHSWEARLRARVGHRPRIRWNEKSTSLKTHPTFQPRSRSREMRRALSRSDPGLSAATELMTASSQETTCDAGGEAEQGVRVAARALPYGDDKFGLGTLRISPRA